MSRHFIIWVLGCLSMMMPLAVDMYLPAIPDIAEDFKVPVGYVQFSLSIFMCGFAIGQILYGTLSDAVGRKPVIAGGLLAFTLLSLLSALSPNLSFFVLMRLLHGFVSASAAVVINAMIRDRFASTQLAKTMAIVALVSNVAPLIAPLLGGWIHHWIHWRAIFLALSAFSALGCCIFMLYIPESLPPEKRHPFQINVFVGHFRSILSHPNSILAIITSTSSFTGMFVFLILGSTVYRQAYAIPADEFGWYFMLNIICMMLFNVLNSRMVGRWGMLPLLKLGVLIQGGMGLLLVGLSVANSPHIWLTITVSVYIGTLALIGANSMALVLNQFPHIAGAASSVLGTIRFGVAAIVGIFLSIGFHSSLLLMTITMALCGLVAIGSTLRLKAYSREF